MHPYQEAAPRVQKWSTARFFNDLSRIRGYGDKATFKMLFFQILMLKCVASSRSSIGKVYSRVESQAQPILAYSDVLIRLAQASQYFLSHDSSPFESIAASNFEENWVPELASRIYALNGEDADQSPQLLFERALQWFARSEGRLGAECTTPGPLAELLIELAAPKQGTLLDPCCGCAGLLVRADRYARTRGLDELTLLGQESDASVRKLAQMHLVANNNKAKLGEKPADSLACDLFPAVKADFILANPPFNTKGFGNPVFEHSKSESGISFLHGSNNHSYAWVQHFIKHMAPGGLAVFTAPNGLLSGITRDNARFREELVRADLIDCIITLPKGLFDVPKIPISVWILSNNKSCEYASGSNSRVRAGETLFIDAKCETKTAGSNKRVLTQEDIAQIVRTYHAWSGLKPKGKYEEMSGFCRSVHRDEIASQEFVLNPNRYIEVGNSENDAAPLNDRIQQLKIELESRLKESGRLDALIGERLLEFSNEK